GDEPSPLGALVGAWRRPQILEVETVTTSPSSAIEDAVKRLAVRVFDVIIYSRCRHEPAREGVIVVRSEIVLGVARAKRIEEEEGHPGICPLGSTIDLDRLCAIAVPVGIALRVGVGVDELRAGQSAGIQVSE